MEGEGEPPDAPSYSSGYCVADVLEGCSDFSADEIEEFREYLTEPRVASWLKKQFLELHLVIQNYSVCQPEQLENGEALVNVDILRLQRVLIEKAALEPAAMEQLRTLKGQ